MDKSVSKLEQQRANAEATRKAKNSRGGGESRPAEAASRSDRGGGPAQVKTASEASAPAKAGRDLDGGGANPPARKRAQGSASGGNGTSAGVATGPREANPVAKATKGKAGTAVVTGHVRRSTTGTGLRVGEAVAVRPATSEFMDATGGESAAHKSKGGRPLAKDADKALMRTQPWKAEGMSRATYYRRQAEKAK